MNEEKIVLEILSESEDERIDKVLAQYMDTLSRSFLQKLLKDGKVFVLTNGQAWHLPLVIGGNETLRYTVAHLYQNWGNHPLKQISSIQFFAPYYHLSTGCTETNCITSYYVHGKDLQMLPDHRAMSAPLWVGDPQHTYAGNHSYLQYTDADGNYSATEDMVNILDAAGPTYADIELTYLSDDGKIKATYTHMEFPQVDENRAYYEM